MRFRALIIYLVLSEQRGHGKRYFMFIVGSSATIHAQGFAFAFCNILDMNVTSSRKLDLYVCVCVCLCVSHSQLIKNTH